MKKTIFSMLFLAFIFPAFGVTSEKTVQIRQGIPCFLSKVQKDKQATIVYYGSTNTRVKGGYCDQTSEWLQSYYSDSKLNIVNASRNLGSVGACIELAEAVFANKPDLVFLEFAAADVNGDPDNTKNAMEGMVRLIKKNNPITDICFIYTLHPRIEKELSMGKIHRIVEVMEQIADYYGIPSINFGFDVEDLIKADKLVFQPEKDKTYEGKIVFKSESGGNTVFADTFKEAFQILTKQTKERSTQLISALNPSNYESIKTLSFESLTKTGDWKSIDFANPAFSGFKKLAPQVIYTQSTTATISFRFKGTTVFFNDLVGPTTCAEVQLQIDNEVPIVKPRFDLYSDRYRALSIMASGLTDTDHTVTIKMTDKQIDKLNIVRKKPITDAETAQYKEPSVFYLTNVMIVGELIK